MHLTGRVPPLRNKESVLATEVSVGKWSLQDTSSGPSVIKGFHSQEGVGRTVIWVPSGVGQILGAEKVSYPQLGAPRRSLSGQRKEVA